MGRCLLLWTPRVGRTARIHLSLHLQVMNGGSFSRVIEVLFRDPPSTLICEPYTDVNWTSGKTESVSFWAQSSPTPVLKGLHSPVSDILIRMCEKRPCLPRHSLSNQLKYPDLTMKGGQREKSDAYTEIHHPIRRQLFPVSTTETQRPPGTFPPFPHSGKVRGLLSLL